MFLLVGLLVLAGLVFGFETTENFLFIWAMLAIAFVLILSEMTTYQKVGGLHFFRFADRFMVSFCFLNLNARRVKKKRPTRKEIFLQEYAKREKRFPSFYDQLMDR